MLRGPRTPEFLAWYDAEADNTWAALDALLASGDEDAAFSLAVLLEPYWILRGRMRQGVAWLETALASAGASTAARGRALGRLGDLLDRLGRPTEAEAVHCGKRSRSQKPSATGRDSAGRCGTSPGSSTRTAALQQRSSSAGRRVRTRPPRATRPCLDDRP